MGTRGLSRLDTRPGISLRKISGARYLQKVPRLQGDKWDNTTIHGNRDCATDIGDTKLYIARQT